MSGEVVDIARLAAGGDGVGRLADGRTVFVPRTAPGDRVTLTNMRLHRRFARASVAEVIEPGAGRVDPRCRHFVPDRCGGCQLQHLAEDVQREARRGFVGDALRRLGKLDLADPPLDAAPVSWGYRSRVTLAASDEGPSPRIGFHRFDRPGDVFDLVHCEIAAPELMALWTAVRARRVLLPAALDRVTLRLDRQGGRHLLLRVTTPTVWAGGQALADALAGAGQPAVVWWQPPEGAARVVAGAREAFPATVFEQVHPVMGDRARAWAVGQVAAGPGDAVWDLYAGIGETTALLRDAGARVESVEADRGAVVLAGGGPESRPEEGLRRHIGRVEEVLPRLRTPDLVIANPPRTGFADGVAEGIAQSGARRVVYVSCDPATLARDLARLGPDWSVTNLRAFDLFPQTAHVETVATVERA